MGVAFLEVSQSSTRCQAPEARASGNPSISRKTTPRSGAFANTSQLPPAPDISPSRVVPFRRLSTNPARTSDLICSGVAPRRWAITCRSQPVKSALGAHRPRNPERSRWVWEFTNPGRMAASPRSTSAVRLSDSPTETMRSPEMVMIPFASGGALTGRIQRAVSVQGALVESVAGNMMCLRPAQHKFIGIASLRYASWPHCNNRGEETVGYLREARKRSCCCVSAVANRKVPQPANSRGRRSIPNDKACPACTVATGCASSPVRPRDNPARIPGPSPPSG